MVIKAVHMAASIFRLVYRTLLALLVAVSFVFLASFFFLLPMNKYRRRHFLSFLTSTGSRAMIRILGIRPEYKGFDKISGKNPWYIMGNHVSFVDVFLLVACFRTLLITSTDMKKRALLGQLATLAGCLFVERRKITTLKDEIPEIGQAFAKSLNVSLFPESTCSNGSALLPFKTALMSAVTGTEAGILPVCIMYRKINSRPFGLNDFYSIGYFGGMKFAPQLIKVMMLESLEVELEVLDPFFPGNMDRKEIGAEVFSRINTRYEKYLNEIRPESCLSEDSPA